MTERSGPPSVLVVGCGGIGGIVTAALSEHDPMVLSEVVALTTNETIAKATEQHGFRLRGEGGERTVSAKCVTALEGGKKFDWILLATQPPEVENAMRRAAPHLAEGGHVVCFQNGLCENRIARVLGESGPSRVVGAIISWGAAMPEPGVYDRTSAGGFTIGRMNGRCDEKLDELDVLLEPLGPVVITKNLSGARWSKLAINCVVSTLGTIAGSRLGPLITHRFARRLALEIMTETVAVARAENVRLEKVSGTLDLEWMALTEAERRSALGGPALVAKHAMLLAVGARYRRMRSSMLAAIERGRTPAIDFLNGEVCDHARRHVIATPVNDAAREAVHAIARKEVTPSLDTLKALAERVGIPPSSL